MCDSFTYGLDSRLVDKLRELPRTVVVAFLEFTLVLLEGFRFLSAPLGLNKNSRCLQFPPVCVMDRHASKPEGKTKRPPKLLVSRCHAQCTVMV